VGFDAYTTWQGVALVTDIRATIVDPDGKVVYDDEVKGSRFLYGSWQVPSNARWGVYTVKVVASKEGYISGQASDTFEVI
jgi:uncharacterized protein YfaS (alpha-2-macroglobulin family)